MLTQTKARTNVVENAAALINKMATSNIDNVNVTESIHQRSSNHQQCQSSCDNQIRTI